MKLNVNIDGNDYPLDIPSDIIFGAKAMFQKMDKDMDNGWQIYRDWVNDLNVVQRCQVVADKLLTAMETENIASKMMMAGYLIYKLPKLRTVYISTDGDITQTEFVME